MIDRLISLLLSMKGGGLCVTKDGVIIRGKTPWILGSYFVLTLAMKKIRYSNEKVVSEIFKLTKNKDIDINRDTSEFAEEILKILDKYGEE